MKYLYELSQGKIHFRHFQKMHAQITPECSTSIFSNVLLKTSHFLRKKKVYFLTTQTFDKLYLPRTNICRWRKTFTSVTSEKNYMVYWITINVFHKINHNNYFDKKTHKTFLLFTTAMTNKWRNFVFKHHTFFLNCIFK